MPLNRSWRNTSVIMTGTKCVTFHLSRSIRYCPQPFFRSIDAMIYHGLVTKHTLNFD